MALKAVKGTFERMLDKNLQDLVRGIRNHKEDETKYIAECLEEIKAELKLDNLASKANAINKLIYLQMLGNDIGWAAFNIIEVMSSTKFTYKRIGYLAASQSFHEQTDVLMLTTNLIRKDLNSPNYYETGVALTGLSCFLTTDLARDLANDIMTLMNSTKPYIRKKAVLLMYKVFLKFPDALRPAFPRLKEKLEDPDPGVQSAAVNVICELARKNPKNYLSLAPLFFKLMNSSNNNWVLIKIIKLFGALTPLEPRLGKKLIEPLTNLIHSTSAMSLLYECINTVIAGIPNHSASIQLCVQKLRILIEDSDQNLKYLGLLAMTKILKSHPKSVQAHKDLILNCLDDKDESIRLRALDLLYGMISRKNIMEIVKKLMSHMEKTEVAPHYRNELLLKIIQITSQDNYQYITNFEWYVTVLVELTRIEGVKNGEIIANQLLDVAIRVPTVRQFTVRQMANLLQSCKDTPMNAKQSGLSEVIYAAAWICGEYAEFLLNAEKTLDCMLHSSSTTLPGHIQSVLVQCSLKLYCELSVKYLKEVTIINEENESENHDDNGRTRLHQLTQSLLDKLASLVHSSDLEVQERAVSGHQLLRYVLKQLDHEQKQQSTVDSTTTATEEYSDDISKQLLALFPGEVNPVTSKAQRKVPIPDDLDLDSWINDPPIDPMSQQDDDDDESSEESEDSVSIASSNTSQQKKKKKGSKKESKKEQKQKSKKKKKSNAKNNLFGDITNANRSGSPQQPELTEEQLEQLRQARIKEQESNPHYLKDTTSSSINPNILTENNSGYISLGTTDDLPAIESLESVVQDEKLLKESGFGHHFPTSDYYLKQQKKIEDAEKKATKHKRKEKKSKKKSTKVEQNNDGDDNDNDVEIITKKHHHVVRTEYDLPEGVEFDANDDNDPNNLMDQNDPHRLLNIDLDKVLEEQKQAKNTTISITKKTKEKTKKNTKTDKKSTKKKKVEKEKPKEIIDEIKTTKEDPFSEWLQTDDKPIVAPSSSTTTITKKTTKKKSKKSLLDDLEPIKIENDEFSNLLSSGNLIGKYSTNIKLLLIKSLNFKKLIKYLCKTANLSIIEEIDKTVSFYAKNGSNHICLLIKLTTNKTLDEPNQFGYTIKIDGKSNDNDMIKNIVKSLKQLLMNKYQNNNENDN